MKSAVRTSAAVFGLIVALSGFQHGVGNALQGSVAPGGLVVQSWPDTRAYEVLSGEPAMTVLPTMHLSGIATMLVSLAVAGWSVALLESSRDGRDLLGLSVLLLLVGGGFGPPLVGAIVGGAAVRTGATRHRLVATASSSTLTTLAALWPALLGGATVSWLFLWPGTVLLSALFGVTHPFVVVTAALSSFVLLIATLVAAFARDGVQDS